MRRLGFTLIEVNLAMFIMAMGTLGLIGLYSFGYRENQQSNEDVQAAAVAEWHLNAMVAALSTTNMTWSAWKGICGDSEPIPKDGWGKYAGDRTGTEPIENDGNEIANPPEKGVCNQAAETAFRAVIDAAGFSADFDARDMVVGIVVTPSRDRRTYSVAVRCGRRAATLVYQPLYYSEVCFQGLRPESEGGVR